MSLRIIYGRAGSGKTYYCLNEIKDRITSGATYPLVLLVPEQYTFQAERDLIKILNTGGILGNEVLSFRRLAYRVFNEVGGITLPHLHSAGKSIIIYKILSKAKNDLRIFTKAADSQGFVATISNLLTEFKRYNLTPEDLKQTAAKLADDDLLKDKLEELGYIYTEYEKNIEEKYRDADDDLTLAARKLEDTDFLTGAEIWVDGFAGFTPQEYKVLAQLLPRVKRLNVCLCTDSLEQAGFFDETDVFAPVKRAFGRLRAISEELGIKMEPAVNLNGDALPRFQNSEELSHLERHFYAYPYKAFSEQTKTISLYSALNIFTEIESVARDIIRLVRDEGLRYRDIAVVTRDLCSYESLIQVIFDEYEIPYFLDRKMEIIKHPLVRLILAMLDIFNHNWTYEAVFSYLKTGLTGIKAQSIDLLENYVLACGIRGNIWVKNEPWTMDPDFLPDEKNKESLEQRLKIINEIRYQVTAPLLEFRRQTKGRQKAADFCAALYDFLCSINIPERIEEQIQHFKANGQLALANEYSQVWNIVMEVLDQVVEVMGEDKSSLEKFSDIFEIAFAEYQVGFIPASLDQVLVGSVERSKSHEIQALYILGVNDGVFPSAAFEEGILSDRERLELRANGLELAQDTRTQAFDEQYLVYQSLTTPAKYLHLSWPIADQEGRSKRPSIIISRLRKIFPKIAETSDIQETGPDEELQKLAAKYPAFREMVGALRAKADGKTISPLWESVYLWFQQQPNWQERCAGISSAFAYKNIAEPVSKEKITSLFGSPVYASVSRLERYNSCPFSFYIQYGLAAKERKIYRLTPPDVGTFLHAVLERFSQLVADQNLSWRQLDRDWCAEQVTSIVDDMLEKMQGSGFAGNRRYRTLARRLQRVVTRTVWLIIEHFKHSSFEPVGYEIGFGDGAELPAIVLELDSGEQIKLTGRIDRIDALRTEEGTYLRIVDYKSGSKDFKLADAYYGLEIQLLTYLDALAENPGLGLKGPVLPGGVLYFKIDDPLIKMQSTPEEIEKAIMKKLKMKGLLLADVKLLKEMDKNLGRTSLIIPASLTKDEQIGRYSSTASLEQFHLLRKYLRRLLKGIGAEILKGNVAINPYKKKNRTACQYCNFTAICQFDPSLQENSYKILPEPKDQEIWKMLAEQIETEKGPEGE